MAPAATKSQVMTVVNSSTTKKTNEFDPAVALASVRHEFGEHGGVNMSIEASAAFTVIEPETMGRMFAGELGPIVIASSTAVISTLRFSISAVRSPPLKPPRPPIAPPAYVVTDHVVCVHAWAGMSAIASVIMQLCSSGGHVVASSKLYGGTHALLSHFLPRACNITTSFVDIADLEAVDSAVVQGKTNVLYLESISNPTLTVADIPELSRIAHGKGVKVVVDNTFSPMVLTPARLGADVVVHSVTKFISGGADIVAGAVCGPASLVNSMMDLHQGTLLLLGPTMNPKVAFDLSERIPHLGLRMKEHSNRAMVYATRMKELGLNVIYPGLPDHPQHNLLKSMANKDYGFGGMLSLDMGTEDRANRLMNQLQNTTGFGLMAVSLGYYENLMSCSSSSTSSELNEKELQTAGISSGLIRMSVGYVGTLEHKWKQFKKAVSKMKEIENV
ncbi:Methionine gamma-lyase [Linum grandiflorum]